MRVWAAASLLFLAGALTPLSSLAVEPAASGGDRLGEPARQVLVFIDLPAPHYRAEGNYAGGYTDVVGSAARRRLVGALARLHGLAIADEWPVPLLGVDCFVVNVPAPREPADVAAELGRDPRIAWTQPMGTFRGLSDDPLFKLQPAAREWQLDELHSLTTGRGVRVAIIDSGVQTDHPDLRGQVEQRLDLVAGEPGLAENHGTAVAGIIAAVANNRAGIAGVAPQASLLALRACHQDAAETRCDTLALARALEAAIERGAQVINLSLSGPSDRLIKRLVEVALGRAIAVVAAVDRVAGRASFPASVSGVTPVTDRLLDDSPPGTMVAPGTDVPSTLSGSRWALVSGASYAAAHVSGLAALVLDARARGGQAPGWSAASLVRGPDGRVDACTSVARAAGVCACRCDAGPPLASTVAH